MQCPKCGAENPANAVNCNLCLHSFVERPAPVEPDGLSVEPVVINPAARAKESSFLSHRARLLAGKGGIAGAAGGLLFLVSLTVIHVSGVRVFDFLFAGLRLSRPNLTFFILLLSLFSLLCGGVGGNLENKKDIVPAIRTVAALVGLSVWAGLIFWLKPADTAFIVWVTEGATGIIAALASLPFVAMFMGLTESFGEDMEMSRALRGAIGGFLSGTATATVVAAAYAITPIFGTAIPVGVLAIVGFSIKLAIIAGVIGFIAGAFLWLAIESAERGAS